MPTHPRLRIDSETGERNDYRFRASGPIRATDEGRTDIDGHEVQGAVGPAEDTIEFSGIPLDFDASDPWDLDLALDMGAGWAGIVPTMLNALTIEIESPGSHYQFFMPEPGMIVRAGTAETVDEIVTKENTFGVGNVRGGVDSFRVWPWCGWAVFPDHDARGRFATPTTPWEDIPGYVPDMRF